jgi:hypothetical protein
MLCFCSNHRHRVVYETEKGDRFKLELKTR